MLLKQCSVPGSSHISRNPLSPLALLGGCYKESVLLAGSLTLEFDFFVDLPKPYNFAPSIYCTSCLPVPYASPEGMVRKAWLFGCRRSAAKGSVLTHLSFLLLFCQVHRHSWHWMYDLLKQEDIWRAIPEWISMLKWWAAIAYVGQFSKCKYTCP